MTVLFCLYYTVCSFIWNTLVHIQRSLYKDNKISNGCIVIKFVMHIHGTQRMNCNCSNLLTFPLWHPLGHSLHLPYQNLISRFLWRLLNTFRLPRGSLSILTFPLAITLGQIMLHNVIAMTFAVRHLLHIHPPQREIKWTVLSSHPEVEIYILAPLSCKGLTNRKIVSSVHPHFGVAFRAHSLWILVFSSITSMQSDQVAILLYLLSMSKVV